MYFKRFSESVATAAVLACAPVVAGATETHTIAPDYPDSFTMRTAVTQDDTKEQFGVVEKTRLNMAASADIQRSGEGYQAVYRIGKFEVQKLGADGKPMIPNAMMAKLSRMVSALGTAKVTLNARMEPVTVDNVEEIKASLKAFTNKDKEAGALDMFIDSLTPESAAQWARMDNKSAGFFNTPLTLDQPVEVTSAPMELMGASLPGRTAITLQSWEEGRSARLRTVLTPSQSDLDGFMSGLMKGLADKMAGGDDAESRAVLARLPSSVSFKLTETCDITADLKSPGNYRSVCDTATTVSIDLLKLGDLKELPKGVPQFLTTSETSHKVSETTVVR